MLTLSHDQATVEYSFSINESIVEGNMSSQSIDLTSTSVTQNNELLKSVKNDR